MVTVEFYIIFRELETYSLQTHHVYPTWKLALEPRRCFTR